MTTLQGRPLLERGSPGEAFRSPSSPEEDPPKMNPVEKGCDPGYNLQASVIVFGSKVGYLHYEVLFDYLQLGRGLIPARILCDKNTL